MPKTACQEFLTRAVQLAEKDPRILGVALHHEVDQEREFTDLELVLVTAPEAFEDLSLDLKAVAGALGPLLLAYEQKDTEGERELTCLYEEPLQRIDLRLLRLDRLHLLHAPNLLWEREGRVTAAFATRREANAPLDLQWMEDRFWLWMHSAATAIRDGSIFEALHLLSCLRTRILAPLVLRQRGNPKGALRHLEEGGGDELSSLRATVPLYDARSCEISLREAAKLYVGLRETLAPATLERHARAEMSVMRHLHGVSERLSA